MTLPLQGLSTANSSAEKVGPLATPPSVIVDSLGQVLSSQLQLLWGRDARVLLRRERLQPFSGSFSFPCV